MKLITFLIYLLLAVSAQSYAEGHNKRVWIKSGKNNNKIFKILEKKRLLPRNSKKLKKIFGKDNDSKNKFEHWVHSKRPSPFNVDTLSD